MFDFSDPYITPELAALLIGRKYRCFGRDAVRDAVHWQRDLPTGGTVDLWHYPPRHVGGSPNYPLSEGWEASGYGEMRAWDDDAGQERVGETINLHISGIPLAEFADRLVRIEQIVVTVYGILAMHQPLVSPFGTRDVEVGTAAP